MLNIIQNKYAIHQPDLTSSVFLTPISHYTKNTVELYSRHNSEMKYITQITVGGIFQIKTLKRLKKVGCSDK